MESIKATINQQKIENEKQKNQSLSTSVSCKGKRGGYRPGSGMKKGMHTKKVLEEKEALLYIRNRVLKSIEPIVSSQMNLAQGVQFLFKIETKNVKEGKTWVRKRSKPILITSEEEIARYLAGDFEDSKDEYYFMTAQKPDNKALDSLLDRVFGKASQRILLDPESQLTINYTNDERNKITKSLEAIIQSIGRSKK